MQFSLQYNNGVFEVKTKGNAAVSVFDDLIKAIVAHEKWKPGASVLIDFTELNASPLTVGSIRTIADLCG